jgi:DNA-binding CsgD family transcriptional regulator
MLEQNFLTEFSPKIVETLPLFACYKDRDFKMMSMSPIAFQCSGCKRYEHTIGLTDYELPWSNAANYYKVQDVDALNGNHYAAVENTKISTGEVLTMLTKKQQVKNQNGEIIGISVFCMPLYSSQDCVMSLNEICARSASAILTIARKSSNIVLTRREEECLFYLLQGRSMKVMGSILTVSPRTIESYIEKLKSKFGCHNKYTLIDKALSLGFGNNIPASLVHKELHLAVGAVASHRGRSVMV